MTQVALVDVKNAVMKSGERPDDVEAGSNRSSVPAMITRKKPRAIVWTYVSCLSFNKPPGL